MPELERWLPAAVALGVVALAVVVAVLVVRAARRGPRARTAAEIERRRAGASIVALDEALADFDLDLALSGALLHPSSPRSLRRTRMTAQHARDDAYAELRAAGAEASPVDIRQAFRVVATTTGSARMALQSARAEHDAWVRTHATPSTLIAAARARLAEARAALGDPAALTRALAEFDEDEWRDAAAAADDALRAADEAAAHLDEAERLTGDAAADARPSLEAAERAIRRAAADERVLEEVHRLTVEASRALPGEVSAARAAAGEAFDARRALPPVDADRVASVVAETTELLDRLDGEGEGRGRGEHEGARRPVAAVHAIALVRARLDEAAAAGLTTQQRVRSARTALPGTLAAARAAVAHVEARLRRGDEESAVAARLLLADAQHDLAVARVADDVVAALAAARRAVAGADEAVARLSADG